ncbi:hypothetical protein FY534_00095 [Alicyclobacillus sp. TC]|uniref:hypothetical protein n=1 Tax=Alicyclobacillus sp. TC TaxID=2606450 RepID=UPI001934850C|nr:hypothetical protein [Alicyclobacillus sp. TC]QRF22259.1 hypothetical protein FY534_00095 [Alicyclobacillus sp. TC]
MVEKRPVIIPKGKCSGAFTIKGISPPPATNGIEVFYGKKTAAKNDGADEHEILLVEVPELWSIRVHLSNNRTYLYDVTPLAKAGGPWRTLRAAPDYFFSRIDTQPHRIIWRVSEDEQECPQVSVEVILREGRIEVDEG